MSTHNKSLGKIGEDFATEYLLSEGYSILQRNYTCRWGELDIIAQKQGKIFFFEVKTRKGTYLGKPHEAVHMQKLRHLQRTIQFYLLQHNLFKEKLQLDVISVILQKDNCVEDFKHYENIHIYR